MKNEKKLKHLFAGITCLVALVVYFMTMAPTVSFWDCGEFVACANTLGIPHPPGTPFFVFLARAVIVVLPFVEEIAKRVNYISVISSAATVYVTALFAWEILAIVIDSAKKNANGLICRLSDKLSDKGRVAVLGSASLVAGFLLTFSDTFWFNAVEAEVYGIAMLILMLVSYLGLVWFKQKDDPSSDRILIFICYIAFLGVGAHLYTMLTVPAVFALLLVAQPKKFLERTPIWVTGILLCSVIYMVSSFISISIGCLIVLTFAAIWCKVFKKGATAGVMLMGIAFPAYLLLKLWLFDAFGIESNLWRYTVLVIVLAGITGIGFSLRRARFNESLNSGFTRSITLSLAFTIFALVGYSTHLYIPIRSELNPIIDENNPEIDIRDEQGNLQLSNLSKDEKWESFNNFIERKQYGSESMIDRAFYRRGSLAHQFLSFPHMGFGGYQMAQYLPFKVGEVSFMNGGTYVFETGENQPLEREIFGETFKFPTQMDMMGDKTLPQFLIFVLLNGIIVLVCAFVWSRNSKMGVFISCLYALCSLGLLFYINFADGTRMDNKTAESQWKDMISSYGSRLGVNVPVPSAGAIMDLNQSIESLNYKIQMKRQSGATPSEIKALEDKKKTYENDPVWKDWQTISRAFARVGAGAPLPQPVHLEVRERDYFYTPAFIFMSLIYGVGAGIFVLMFAMRRKSSKLAIPVGALLALVAFAVPCTANYKEHDRSGLWVPWDYAYNLLNSCRPNAILFTNGDNDTFPLWFAQEVAGIRKDVRVVNLSLGNTDWYIEQMLANEPILKLSYHKDSDPCVKEGRCKGIKKDMELTSETANNPEHSVVNWVSRAQNLMPKLMERITAMEGKELSPEDSSKLLQFKTHYQIWDAFNDWAQRSRSGMMLTQNILVMDLAFQNADKPIEISTTVGTSNFMGLEKYMVQEGMVYHFIKGDMEPKRNAFDAAYTANLIDSVFQFRGLGDGTAYINDETERLLSGYVSLYLQLAFDTRDQIEALRGEKPFTIEHRNEVDSLAKFANKYLEMGMTQFKSEWRNYWAAAVLFQSAGHKKDALNAVERGLENVPEYETGARDRLEKAKEQIEMFMSDDPLPVEAPAPVVPAEEVPGDSAVVAAAN